MMPRSNVQWLLEDLCVKFGFCIPPAEQKRLAIAHPDTAEDFVAAVVKAEGSEIGLIDKHLRREMEEYVRARLPTSVSD
jgi:hypothetical protein